jgi:hypothetical protein
MEYVMYFPCVRELEFVGDVRYFGGYLEGSVPPWSKFHCFIRKA